MDSTHFSSHTDIARTKAVCERRRNDVGPRRGPRGRQLALLLLSVLLASPAAGQRADPLDLSPPVVGLKYRLGISVEPAGQGLRVTAIGPGSPTRQMRSATQPNLQGRLEVGDVISRVNAVAVTSLDEIQQALDASQGRVRLTVSDPRRGTTHQWDVQPLQAAVRRADLGWDPRKAPILFALLIANTNDPTIGDGVRQSLEAIKRQLQARIRSQQLNLTVLEGERCNAAAIVRELALLPSSELDSILVYYMGHGAYDPRFAGGDPSGGHFIDLPGKDVLRRTVWEYLHDAPAKLRIVVTDACNVESEADPFKYRLEMRTRLTMVQGATNLEWLLLGHSGELDLSAASRGQYAWYSNNFGGYFSTQWEALANDDQLQDWPAFLTRLRAETNRYFRQERAVVLAEPGALPAGTLSRLRGQDSMFPTTFVRNVTRDVMSPVDPTLRRGIESHYVVRLRSR